MTRDGRPGAGLGFAVAPAYNSLGIGMTGEARGERSVGLESWRDRSVVDPLLRGDVRPGPRCAELARFVVRGAVRWYLAAA